MADNPTQHFYDRISQAYDLIADGGEHAARLRGLKLLNVQAGESVLEIGFGTGHALLAFAERVGSTGQVTGVDISPGMRDVAHHRLQKAGFAEQVRLLVQAVPPLPMDDACMDVVSMSFTLELFPMEVIPHVLAECRRVLKPTGRLGVVGMATVDEGEQASVLEKTYIWMHTHFPHIVDCQPIPLEAMVTEAGFTLSKQERLSIFSMPVAAIVATRDS